MLASLALTAILGCADSTKPAAGSESHFLMTCETSAECGGALACVAQVCTQACESDVRCQALAPEASCEDAVGQDGQVCDARCSTNADCAALAAAPECVRGHCRASEPAHVGEADASTPTTPAAPEAPNVFAFKAGFGVEEEIWVRDESGAVTRVSDQPRALRDLDCSEDETDSFGMPLGRFGDLSFDHDASHLLFFERRGCTFDGGGRLLAFSRERGETVEVGDYATEVIIVGDNRHTVVLQRSIAGLTLVAAHEWIDGQLVGLEIPSPGDDAYPAPFNGFVRVGGQSVLSLKDIGVFVFRDDRWRATDMFDSVRDVSWAPDAVSATGEYFCSIGSPDTDAETEPVITGHLRGADGGWDHFDVARLADSPRLMQSCAFTRDEAHVAFGDRLFEIRNGRLGPQVARIDGFQVRGSFEDRFLGTRAGQVVSVSTSGEDIQVLAEEEIAGLCAQVSRETSVSDPPQVWVRADRSGQTPIALVVRDCTCRNCLGPGSVTGTVAVSLATGEASVVEAAGEAHTAYQAQLVHGGGALIVSSQGQTSPSPAPGRLFQVDEQATVTLEALPGIDAVVREVAVPFGQHAHPHW